MVSLYGQFLEFLAASVAGEFVALERDENAGAAKSSLEEDRASLRKPAFSGGASNGSDPQDSISREFGNRCDVRFASVAAACHSKTEKQIDLVREELPPLSAVPGSVFRAFGVSSVAFDGSHCPAARIH